MFPVDMNEDCKPKKEVICSDCYIPNNPTKGWLLSTAQKKPEFDFIKYKDIPEGQQERFLRKFLKFEPPKETDEDHIDERR